MAQINIKLTEEQKEQIQAIASSNGMSVTQLILTSILDKEKVLDGIEGKERIESGIEKDENILYKELYEVLLTQLQQKDIQIDQLHKIIYNKDTLLIEMDTKKKHWWQFWIKKDIE